jgi:hypothetical protein
MTKNVKFNENAKRHTILVDDVIYRRAKSIATNKGLKWYQFLNKLLADATGLPFPDYLKHVTPDTKKIKNKK